MKSNKINKITGLITHNFGLKLLAVIVSCGLWFAVDNINDPVTRKLFTNIPVEIVNENKITSEGKVYEIIDNTSTTNVWVRGKSSILKDITRDDIRAEADMAELTFMNTVGIKISSARNNSELEFTSSVENVKLSIEDVKRGEQPILTATSGEPAEGYIVSGISPSQNVVRYSGPESLINQIDHAEAVVNVNGYSSDVITSGEIKLYDADDNEIRSSSIKLNISAVNITVTILPTKEVPLDFVTSDSPASGYVVSREEPVSVPETVTIAGRKNVLDGITKITIADSALSLKDKTEDFTTIIDIRKYLPANTQFADSEFSGNVSVTIGIEALVTRELEIPARNFAADIIPEGLNLTLREVGGEDPQPYRIRISGTQAAVDAVNEEEIIGVVDMDALLQSTGLEEWQAGTYTGELRFNLPEDVTLEGTCRMTVILENPEDDSENAE
ncbi:MAG: CdaR family protein [Roseburia sp.]|nr:CdaR family protein [Roseburia sp.]